MDKNESYGDLERSWIEGIRSGDEIAFEKVFLKYYSLLSSIAADYTGSYDAGKEVAHEVLSSLWERGSDWILTGSLKAYLCQAVINRSITFLKKERRRHKMLERYSVFVDISESNPEKEIENEELKKRIWSAVRKMPPKRYLVFMLHKRYELSYKEIASALDISIKTVENQMGSALKFVRDELSDLKVRD